MPQIKINLATSRGFCFGVKRALQIAFQTAAPGKTIEMLGNIVHNEEVIREIECAGIKKIKRLGKGKNKILLIRAHGASKATFIKARKRGYTIVDATCPMVKEIHKIAARMEKNGYRIIVIGDKKHDEVLGITGVIKRKALVIDTIENINWKAMEKIKRAAIVVQSTQNIDNVLKIVKALKPHIPELRFFNTICRPTRLKQQEIKTMPLKNDIMIIIGSKNSANTKRLYEISKSLNKRSYWIQSKEEIKPAWFKNVGSVGITSGASTPDSTTKYVIDYIKNSLKNPLL